MAPGRPSKRSGADSASDRSRIGATDSATQRAAPDAERFAPLFESLREDDADHVSSEDLFRALGQLGLRSGDQRLQPMHQQLARIRSERGLSPTAEIDLDARAFGEVVRGSLTLVERALRGDLVIPDFPWFERRMAEQFEASREERGGEVATYIPQLARVDAEKWGLAACTIDGQRMALGDTEELFCLQSSCKPLNYCIALEENGADIVHQHIGFEPSGQSFNELSLNRDGRPHNPMINAGAIMACSLIGRKLETADRFDYVSQIWQRLTGGVRPGFANAVYLSERKTADRNFALGYFMREHGAFPAGTDLKETLEFYFQCCSLELTADDFAVVAATLANGGVCPLTEDRVLHAETVSKCLSLMESCGMYDYSGEWAFRIGLPAKSGVSGAILVVVPDVFGMCIWSPRLDSNGNSVRGIHFCKEVVSQFNFHHYDNLADGLHSKKDPRLGLDMVDAAHLAELLWAASKDDITGLRRVVARGQPVSAPDYDGRTALHVAASEGRLRAIEFLLARGADLDPVDRWGGRPLDDAKRHGHTLAAEKIAAAMQARAAGGSS